MPYVKTIKEDGVVSGIMAKAIDPTLDATLLHKSELVNGFTQTTPGVNALDAAAGKTLNETKIGTLYVETLAALFAAVNAASKPVLFEGNNVVYAALTGASSSSSWCYGIARPGSSSSVIEYFVISANGRGLNGGRINSDGTLAAYGNYVREDTIDARFPFYFSFTTIGASGSKVFTASNNTSIWILWAGGNNSTNGIASMRLVDNNNANFHSINAGAGTTTTLSAAWNTSTGKLTLSNSAGASIRCFIFSEKQMTAE